MKVPEATHMKNKIVKIEDHDNPCSEAQGQMEIYTQMDCQTDSIGEAE